MSGLYRSVTLRQAVLVSMATISFVRLAVAQEPRTVSQLPALHTVLTQEISKQSSHRYEIELPANQYLAVTITKADLNVTARVFGPGKLVYEFVGVQYEPLQVSFIASQAGKYRLELYLLDKHESLGVYDLEVQANRGATSEDQKALAARRLMTEAVRLKAEWKESSTREAILKQAKAVKLWRALGQREEAAQTLLALGDTHFSLSEYRTAEKFYLQASESTSDEATKFRAFTRAGYVKTYLGQSTKALESAERALSYHARVRSKPGRPQEQRDEAEAQNAAGEANYALSRLKQAIHHFTRALEFWKAAADRSGQALANLNLAYGYSEMGDLNRARECLDAALALSREINDRRREAMALTTFGTIQSFWGEKQAALDKHGQARDIMRVIGDHAGEAVALNSIGRAYEDLNEPETALHKYRQALQIYQELGNRDFEAVTRFYLGRVYATLRENQTALKYFRESLKQSQLLGQRRLTAFALTAISVMRSTEGHTAEALISLNKVLQIYREMKDRRGQATSLNEIGRIYQAKGQTKKALGYYEQALPFMRSAGDRHGEAETLYLKAVAARDLGSIDEALDYIKESNQAVESLRARIVNPELRASYFASVQKHSALHIDLLMKLNQLYPEKHFAKLAFEAHESARARAFLETMGEGSAKIRQGVDPALLARERSLQEQLTAMASYHMQVLSTENKNESEVAEREIRELTTAYQELQTQIRQQSPRYANFVNPQPLKLEEVQAELQDHDTLLLEYSLDEEKSYLWAISSNSFTAVELPGRNRIEAVAHDVLKLLTARETLVQNAADYQDRVAEADKEYWRQAAMLSEMVLGPIAHLMGRKRLLIVPDGKLQYIPFAALPVPGLPQDQMAPPSPLVLRTEISSLPSASILTVIRGHKPADGDGRLIAVLADPVFERSDPRVRLPAGTLQDAAPTPATPRSMPASFQYSATRDIIAPGANAIPRLLATRQEAEAIMALIPAGAGFAAMDFNAGKAITAGGELGQYRIVHFATHGVINTQHPELSGIMLSMVNSTGQTEDGFLQMHDIYNLDLSHTQLVVLSACRTGLGKDVKGEGLMGLTRGFMYAGSKSVIASLWKVDDHATAELMKHFYKAMLEEGLPPAAALRKAKEAMWQQPRWHAPYFWAAFVLQGEYRDSILPPQTSRRSTPIIAAAVALLLVTGAGLYLLVRRRNSRAAR